MKPLQLTRPRRRTAFARPLTACCGAALFLALVAGGCGVAEFRVENEPSLEAYLARFPGRPLLVVDIDDTIMRRNAMNSIRLWSGVGYRGDPPLDGAPETLRRLETQWNLVFLTARDDSMRKATLTWLSTHGFPAAPVVFSQRYLYRDDGRAEFKREAIRRLLEKGFKPGWGIGDKASDMIAYRENGLQAILILAGPYDPDLDQTLALLNVPSIGLGAAPAPPEVMILEQSKAWEEIGKKLDPAAPPPPEKREN